MHDVELPRVGQGADSEGLGAEEVQQREYLIQLRAREVERLCRAGQVSAHDVPRCRTMSLSIGPGRSLLWNMVPREGRSIAFRFAVSAAMWRSFRLGSAIPRGR
jgi:hypothetical protein